MTTSLMRRNPFGAVDATQSRMWDWFTTPMGHTPISKLFGEINSYVPPVDIYETNEEVIVAANLPGLATDKLDIQILEDQLTLTGEQNSFLCFEPEENMTQHLQGIPRFGRFSFTFGLPCAVETAQSQAKYDNGLLCMRFLKAQKHRPVCISLNNGANVSQPLEVGSQPVQPQEITAQSEPEQASAQRKKTTK